MMIRVLNESDADQFLDLRLKSLLDSPDAFGTLYEEEIKKPKDEYFDEEFMVYLMNSI